MFKPTSSGDFPLALAGMAATIATQYMRSQLTRKSSSPALSRQGSRTAPSGPGKPSPYPVVIRRARKKIGPISLRRRRRRRTRKYSGNSRRKGPVAYMSRRKILDILTVPNTYTYERFDTQTLPANNATSGPRCVYFAVNNAPAFPNASLPFGLKDPFVLRTIANKITNGATNPSIGYNIINAVSQQILTNASNCSLKVVAYKVMARTQLPTLNPYNLSIQAILGRGFASAGYDSSNIDHSNAGNFQCELTPFQSPQFCQAFKVLSSQTVILPPGQSRTFSLYSKGFHVSPNTMVSMTSTQTYLTGTVIAEWQRGETFYLFKIMQNQIANDIVSTDSGTSGFAKVNMHSKYRWNYKFTQDNQRSVTVSDASNFVTPGAATSVRFINQLQAAVDTMKTS